jgi:hypothetical protein
MQLARLPKGKGPKSLQKHYKDPTNGLGFGDWIVISPARESTVLLSDAGNDLLHNSLMGISLPINEYVHQASSCSQFEMKLFPDQLMNHTRTQGTQDLKLPMTATALN